MDYVFIYRIRDFKIKIMKKYIQKYVPAHNANHEFCEAHILGKDTLLDTHLSVRFKVLVRRQMF